MAAKMGWMTPFGDFKFTLVEVIGRSGRKQTSLPVLLSLSMASPTRKNEVSPPNRFPKMQKHLLASFLVLTPVLWGQGADWPMWRHDPGRTASSDHPLQADLSPKWIRELPPLTPAYRDVRLQFDAGYEPIAFGKRVFVGSSHDNSVTAYDAETGAQLWKYYANGPVRFAPVGGEGRLIFGSDDGWVYCLRASQGDLVWKFQAVPSERKVLGNDRLISVWPIRGGPVLVDGRIYFAAGVWPLEGVFLYCLDAASGEVVWQNDSSSYLYGKHPHNTEAFGGIAPQGYLLVENGDLLVPCSNAYPARFDLDTGELIEFELPSPGRLPGGWFTAARPDKAARRGLVFDQEVNEKRHEDRLRSEGEKGVRRKVALRDREVPFAKGYPGVEGEIHSVIAADGNLIIATVEGKLYCFGETGATPRQHPLPTPSPPAITAHPALDPILDVIGSNRGYAVVLSETPDLAEGLARESDLRVIAVSSTPFTERPTGLGSARLSYRTGNIRDYQMPPYFAKVLILDFEVTRTHVETLYQSVRPYGGALLLTQGKPSDLGKANLPGGKLQTLSSGLTLIRREGALAGSTNYLGNWDPSPDALVQAPLGVLWFGDQVSHFKRSPQPLFIDGVMISFDKDWTDASTRTRSNDYRLLEARFTDAYTGRPLERNEAPQLRESAPEVDHEIIQPSQYRPPKPNDRKGPVSGIRLNPLTGLEEPRKFFKTYGCDGGMNYGNLYTLRSGTAAYYDLNSESGTINISGPRSGCTNSVIPANGLLNLPYFYEGCTCSYPLPMALSLVSMPESFEQWMAWGEIPAADLHGKIERLGINLGAPGDRKTRDGTLWLDYPSVGGPSPEVVITTVPENPHYTYRHSIWMQPGEEAWPWVAASAATNLQSITIEGLKPGRYEVRLTFPELEPDRPAAFEVSIQEEPQPTRVQLGPLREPQTSQVHSFPPIAVDGKLTLHFSHPAPLSGLEIIPADPPE